MFERVLDYFGLGRLVHEGRDARMQAIQHGTVQSMELTGSVRSHLSTGPVNHELRRPILNVLARSSSLPELPENSLNVVRNRTSGSLWNATWAAN